MTYDPWRDAAQRHPAVHVEPCDCKPFRGALVRELDVILVESSLRRPERDEVLAHEIAHLDLDHAPTGHVWFDRRQEMHADELAAWRLVSARALAEAIAEGAFGSDEVARHLEIPAGVIERRLRLLTDAEKDYIERRVAAKGAVA